MLNLDYVKQFPEKIWVYLWKKKDKVLYVGKAKNIRKRLEQYFRTWIWVWKEDMVSKADNIDYFLAKNEEEALLLEEKLVKQYNPPYNSLLKWDNAYIYIHIWEGIYPKIEFTHFKNKKGTYIGPKTNKKYLKNMFLLLRRILKFRTCSDTKFKKWQLCSDYTLWLCAWRCNVAQVNSEKWKISRDLDGFEDWIGMDKNDVEWFNNDVEWYYLESSNNHLESSNNHLVSYTSIIKDFFSWKTETIKKVIITKINKAIEEENFEYANVLKWFYNKIEDLSNKQSIELEDKVSWFFVKIRKEKNMYFMVYMRFLDWKLIDIVKLKNDENNFLQEMKNEWIINEYKKLWENYYFAK